MPHPSLIHTYIHTHTHTHTLTHTRTRTRMRTRTRTRTRTSTRSRTPHTHMHTHARTHARTHTHTYTRTHTNTHTGSSATHLFLPRLILQNMMPHFPHQDPISDNQPNQLTNILVSRRTCQGGPSEPPCFVCKNISTPGGMLCRGTLCDFGKLHQCHILRSHIRACGCL